MYDFQFKATRELVDRDVLKTGVFLLIWNPESIPPHIGILIDGEYFSLKYSGKDFSLPLDTILHLIQKDHKKIVFQKIKTGLTSSRAISVFNRYETTKAGKITCLSPIRELLEEAESETLSELLKNLDARSLLSDVFQLNLRSKIGILPYTKADINKRLDELDVKRSKYLFKST